MSLKHKCSKCGKTFEDISDLVEHQRNEHPSEIIFPKMPSSFRDIIREGVHK